MKTNESMIGKKVEAEFQDGDKLILTVDEECDNVPFVMRGVSEDKVLYHVGIFWFKEKNICTWWYKDLCKAI
jgi:hypothetical protein